MPTNDVLLLCASSGGYWLQFHFMAKGCYGTCFKCHAYGHVEFRSTKDIKDEETGEVLKKGRRFAFCLGCLTSPRSMS